MTTTTPASDARYSSCPRQHERIAHLVLGEPRPAPPTVRKPKGMSRMDFRARKATMVEAAIAANKLSPDIEQALTLRENWSHRQGTPETLERAARTHQGSLARLCRSGAITPNQLAAAEEIRAVVESIHAEVAMPIASWEARVDSSSRHGEAALGSIRMILWERAYSRWRREAVAPVSMLLDMIVDDTPYTVAAVNYRMSARRAKRLLTEALDQWWTVRTAVGREWCDIAADAAAAGAGLLV